MNTKRSQSHNFLLPTPQDFVKRPNLEDHEFSTLVLLRKESSETDRQTDTHTHKAPRTYKTSMIPIPRATMVIMVYSMFLSR